MNEFPLSVRSTRVLRASCLWFFDAGSRGLKNEIWTDRDAVNRLVEIACVVGRGAGQCRVDKRDVKSISLRRTSLGLFGGNGTHPIMTAIPTLTPTQDERCSIGLTPSDEDLP